MCVLAPALYARSYSHFEKQRNMCDGAQNKAKTAENLLAWKFFKA